MVVNAVLDDASTKTYVNSDVAAELGFKWEISESKGERAKWPCRDIGHNTDLSYTSEYRRESQHENFCIHD